MEIWKDIEGYKGYYQVSDHGRVKSLERKVKGKMGLRLINIRIMRGGYANGYRTIELSKNSRCPKAYIHRLVCTAFLLNPENKRTINHKDGNKLNNKKSNLEWATDSENSLHSFRELGRKPGRSKLVINTETGIYYESGKEAAEATLINYNIFRGMLNGSKTNKTNFKYA